MSTERDIPKSTDLIYCSIPAQRAIELANAVGTRRRILTRSMLSDDRIFYGQCVSAVMMNLHILDAEEQKRRRVILAISDMLYAFGIDDFRKQMAIKKPEINALAEDIEAYARQLTAPYTTSADKRPPAIFDSEVFRESSYLRNNGNSWMTLVAQTVDTILGRLQNSLFTIPIGSDLADKIRYVVFSTKTICAAQEHFHEAKRISSSIVEENLDVLVETGEINQLLAKQGLMAVKKATPVAASKRKAVVFLGGIGMGKSELMKCWWEKVRDDKEGWIIVNTDYNKYALMKRAEADGKLEQGHANSNTAHEEAAIASHEVCVEYATRAKSFCNPRDASSNRVPNVAIETDVLDDAWKQAAIAGNAPVKIHFVSAPLNIAEESVVRRRDSVERDISKQRIADSSQDTLDNLLYLSEKKYNGVIYLYNRKRVDKYPSFVGAINLVKRELFVKDVEGLLDIASRSDLDDDPKTATRLFIKQLLDKKISICVLGASDQITCRLNSKSEFEYVEGATYPKAVGELKKLADLEVPHIREPSTSYAREIAPDIIDTSRQQNLGAAESIASSWGAKFKPDQEGEHRAKPGVPVQGTGRGARRAGQIDRSFENTDPRGIGGKGRR